MKVRLFNGDNPNAYRDHAAISKAVDDELAKSGERLVRLIGNQWTGFAEGPTSPWIVYSVEYEAGPRD